MSKSRRKLTDDQEREIRRLFFKAGYSGEQLAREFGVSTSTLTRILGESPGGRGTKLERVWS